MTRRKKIGLVVATGVALVGGLAAATAVIIVPCRAGAVAEPKFRPGILGLTMVDVREHKHLWREIEELQKWERADRISIAEYRSKVIEKTGQFLRLGGAEADEFAAVASGAITTTREAFLTWRRDDGDPKVREVQFSSDMRGAVTRVTSFLQKEPRHQLFVPQCKKWLLKLAFGPKEAKEAKEAKQG